MVAEIVCLSDHPGRVEDVRDLLRKYILLPDVWEALGPVPMEVPKFFTTELDQFPHPAVPPTGEVLVATHRSAVVGFGEVVPVDADTCELRRVHVAAEHEGLGIGTLLARTLLDEARHLGYLSVILDVLPSRQRALALWSSVGFEEIDPYRSYPFPMVFMGRALDDVPGVFGQ